MLSRVYEPHARYCKSCRSQSLQLRSGRRGALHAGWYREGPEATWLAGYASIATGERGHEAREGSSSSIQIIAIGGPLRQSKVPTKSPSVGPRTESGDGAAGCRARRHLQPARPLRLSCCLLFLWPSAPDSGGGPWEGTKGAASPAFSPSKGSNARICTGNFFFSTKRCAVCGGRVTSCVLCSHWRECGNQTLSGLHSSCFVPRPGYDKGDAPIWPAEFSWAHLCSLTVESRLAAALSSVSRTEELDRTGQALCESTRAGQRKLSLSSRDDPNYKDIMRLRAQLADTLL